MKGLIELSNFVVENFSSKCTNPSETKGKVSVKMYGKCMVTYFKLNVLVKATIGFKSDVHQSCRA